MCKHCLLATWPRFESSPPYIFLLSLVSSDPRPSGVKQVSDFFRDLYFFSEVFVPSLTRISDDKCPTYRKSESDLTVLKSPKTYPFPKKVPTYRKSDLSQADLSRDTCTLMLSVLFFTTRILECVGCLKAHRCFGCNASTSCLRHTKTCICLLH